VEEYDLPSIPDTFFSSSILNGFVLNAPIDVAQAIAYFEPKVNFVEQDFVVNVSDASTSSWSLDRIDQRSENLNGLYELNDDWTTGEGVNVYVLDTGIQSDHSEFSNVDVERIANTIDVGDGDHAHPIDGDCNGHGTHVAGSVAGRIYGVAKGVNLKDVKVFNCNGQSTGEALLAGLEAIAKDVEKDNNGSPSTVNMSISGKYSKSVNMAVQKLVKNGVTTVVAAGNDNKDACEYSPASESKAITVASIDDEGFRSSFSNYGSCVDIFAPGSYVTSASAQDLPDGFKTESGTSQATPHVVGATALILQQNPQFTPYQVRRELRSYATKNKVYDTMDSPNLLLFVGGFGDDSMRNPTTSPVPTDSPTQSSAPSQERVYMGRVASNEGSGLTSGGVTILTVTITFVWMFSILM